MTSHPCFGSNLPQKSMLSMRYCRQGQAEHLSEKLSLRRSPDQWQPLDTSTAAGDADHPALTSAMSDVSHERALMRRAPVCRSVDLSPSQPVRPRSMSTAPSGGSGTAMTPQAVAFRETAWPTR